MGVNGGDVALEPGVSAAFAVHRQHCVEDLAVVATVALLGLAEGGEDEGGLGRVEVLAQGFDETHEVRFVAAGVGLVVAVLVTLPPAEAGDLVALRARIVGVELRQHLLRVGGVVVILLAGIPRDGLRVGALFPAVGRLLVTGVDPGRLLAGLLVLGAVLVAFAPRWQQVPAETAVADAALEDEHGFRERLAELMADADFRPDGLALDRQPFVVVDAHAAAPTDHHADVADFIPLGPLAGVVHEEGVELLGSNSVFERAGLVRAGDLAEAEHVRLAHQDEDLDRLRQVGGLAIGVRQIDGVKGRGGECGEPAQGDEADDGFHGQAGYKRSGTTFFRIERSFARSRRCHRSRSAQVQKVR